MSALGIIIFVVIILLQQAQILVLARKISDRSFTGPVGPQGPMGMPGRDGKDYWGPGAA